jgi:two-component system LytT family response regulator
MTIRTLIVDDEPLGRQRLRTLLAAEPDVTVLGECEDGAGAVATLREVPCDLVFLDVQMPPPDGLEVVRTVGPERMPAVIFVTAYDCYALSAFDVHAVDYLLKPFDRQRFRTALARAKARLGRQTAWAGREPPAPAPAPEVKPAPRALERVMIKSAGRLYFVRTEEIDWVEACGNYLRLHAGGQTHLLRETMSNLQARLDPLRFLRIHRSAIVNVERVLEFQPLFHGDYVVLLRDGTQLTLSRTYRQNLSVLFGDVF